MRAGIGHRVGSRAFVCLAALVSSLVAAPAARKPQAVHLAAGVSVRNLIDPFDYFVNSWAVIGLKDYPEATRISPGGEFLLSGGRTFRLLVGEGLAPLNGLVKKTLEKGYLPIVRYDFVLDERIEYKLEFLACPIGTDDDPAYAWPADPNFLNLGRLTVRNLGTARATAVAAIEWNEKTGVPAARDVSGANEWAVSSGGALIGAMSARPGVRVLFEGRLLKVAAELAGKEAESVLVCAPFNALEGPPPETVLELARADFDARRARTAAFWEGLLARAARLHIPEAKPFESYMASLVYQFIGRDRGELHAGEGFYDTFYLRDGAYQAISLAHAGYLDEARRSLEVFPRFQKATGQFVSQDGQLDANGYAVWALAEYGLLSGDKSWLEENYPLITRSVAFARELRGTEKSPDSPFFGILPAAPADGENLWPGKNHIVGYDLWNLRAVQSAAEVAAMLGKADDRDALLREFEAYRKAILAAVDRTGLPYLPPSYEKEGTHWGNLESIFPTQLIEPYDRRLSGTLEHVRTAFGRDEGRKPGFIEGTMQWTPKTGAIHPYMSLFVTNSHIVRGEQDKAVDGFYSYLLHSTSTQGFPEGVYPLKREAWGDTLPHLWAAALYVTTLRNMLVREDGEDLHLFSAVPAAWLEPGKTVAAEDMPTRFGRMSLEAECRDGLVVVRFTRPERSRPQRVLVHLPPGLEITEVGRCGKGLRMSPIREIYIPGASLTETTELRLFVRRDPKASRPDFAAKVAEFLAEVR